MIYKHGMSFLDQKSLDSFEKGLDVISKKYSGVDLSINSRWENGIKHHKRSTALMNKIKELDFYIQGDYFCWKTGGDGDNGEALLYLLDIIFEHEDKTCEATIDE